MRPPAPRVSPPRGQTFMEKARLMSPSPGGHRKATGEKPDSETALPHFPGTTVPDARAPRGMRSLEAPTEVPGMGIPYTHIPVSRYYDLLRGVYVRDEFIHQLSTELVGVERRLEE
ncbi:hypothetical protein NE237_010856 [Protea cynaroides]|uniref:Uncharacterized protein n=1 Tax=Protea cynaroides TaxID=273540 RepID=A0A9Q0L1E8_9MAGN|nr:hypothetical protein NE237_010856 [Protea cynaroides]